MTLDAETKLEKARINIQRKNPFFAYLSLFLTFEEQKNWEGINSLGASIDIKGTFRYKREFIEEIPDNQLEGVIVHEILHLALLHMIRTGDRQHELANISQDIEINQILKDNKFNLPDGCIWSNNNNEVELFPEQSYKQVIKKCNEKTWEQIYDEIKIPKELKKKIFIGMSGNGTMTKEQQQAQKEFFEKLGYKQLDEHIHGDNGKPLSEEEKEKRERDWLRKVQEAYVISKMRGTVPAGIERLIGKLHESRVRWRDLLYRYITSYFQNDYTYARPFKKSISSGYYMPDYTKEKIKVHVMIDVSGSIGDEELVDFVSEIVGIARGFQSKIDMTLTTHETEVNGKWDVKNGQIEQIKKIQIKGGGGTDFVEPLKWVNENIKDCKVLIWLTDGYGTEVSKKDAKFPIIWVLSENGSDSVIKDAGRIIHLGKK